MNKKLKIFLIILLTICLIGFVGYNYAIYGGERNLDSEKAQFSVTSKSISDEFSSDIDVANKKYLEKAVAISGVVTSAKNHEVIIDNTIICNFKNIDNSIKVDQNISIKGRIVGFDDLLGELKLDQCFLNK